jgi:hypothetical protein
MKIIQTPNHPTLKQVCLGGRIRPKTRCRRIHLSNYIRALPTAPSSVDYTAKAQAVLSNVYLNETLGDCVIAGGYHVLGVVSGNADQMFAATNDQIIADYSAIGGYKPGDPSTDNGCDETVALDYWTQHGFADGSKLSGWASLDPSDVACMQAAAWLFENLYYGFELPDGWISPFPSGNGFTWDVAGDPDQNNGHCVMSAGYDASGVKVCTWGLIGNLTWKAIAKYGAQAVGGEVYCLLSPDMIAKGQQKAPNGVAWDDLIGDLATLNGGPVPPAPTPPQPVPPAQAVTLQQAQAWAQQGLAMNWPGSGS